MPKVFLTEKQKQEDLIVRILLKYMGAQKITSISGLADKLNINKDRMLRRFKNPSKLTLEELKLIARYLHIPDDEVMQILKGATIS